MVSLPYGGVRIGHQPLGSSRRLATKDSSRLSREVVGRVCCVKVKEAASVGGLLSSFVVQLSLYSKLLSCQNGSK